MELSCCAYIPLPTCKLLPWLLIFTFQLQLTILSFTLVVTVSIDPKTAITDSIFVVAAYLQFKSIKFQKRTSTINYLVWKLLEFVIEMLMIKFRSKLFFDEL